MVEIGRLCDLKFRDTQAARDFCGGYRSGMARIAKGSYNYPHIKEGDNWFKRGYRFAFLAHMTGRRTCNEDFPDAVILEEDTASILSTLDSSDKRQ